MPPRRVEIPLPGPDDPDPIQGAYGVPTGPAGLLADPVAPPAPPPPEEPRRPGESKWPQARALAYLSACPKLPVYVPLEPTEQDGHPHYAEVIWQGWLVPVPKGRTIYVPAPIAEIAQQSMERLRTWQAKRSRSVDMMLITPSNPGGMIVEEYSDPMAVELARRGAPLRMDT